MGVTNKALTKRQEAFCIKFVETGNKDEAYRHGFENSGNMSSSSIMQAASRLLRLPKIIARIEQLRDVISKEALVDATAVIKRLGEIAFADPNELTSYRRYNCRHCRGVDNKHQWVDENEFALAIAKTIDMNATAKKPKPMPNDEGGYGFIKHAYPVPGCPVCHGDGVEVLHIADTRRLSAEAKSLYAGAEKTKEGIKIKMHSQSRALELLAKHFRVIGPDNVTVVNTNVTNIPETAVVPLDPQAAARYYQDLMQGKKSS